MRILAIDTVTEGCSAALLITSGDGSAHVVERFEELARGHADRILTFVDEVLAEGGIGLRALDGIAVNVGPGAFTGVRIGVSVGQALAFGVSVPVVPVTSLAALAAQIMTGNTGLTEGDPVAAGDRPEFVVACLDARMGEVYWGCYRAAPDGDVVSLAPLAVAPPASLPLQFAALSPSGVAWRGVGRGFAAYPELAGMLKVALSDGDTRRLPRARDAARLAALRLAADGGIDAAALAPVYLRDKVAFTEAERALQRS